VFAGGVCVGESIQVQGIYLIKVLRSTITRILFGEVGVDEIAHEDEDVEVSEVVDEGKDMGEATSNG
jgi:hypothetical protein